MWIKNKEYSSESFDREYIVNRDRYINELYFETDRLKRFLEYVGNFEGKKILDIGGGSGILAKRLSENNDYTLIDFSKEAIDLAKDKSPKARLICVNAVDYLKENREHFDLVIMTDVVEEMPQETFNQTRSLLNTEYLLLSTPCEEGYLELTTHLVIYTEEELLEMFKDWEIVKKSPKYGQLLVLLKK